MHVVGVQVRSKVRPFPLSLAHHLLLDRVQLTDGEQTELSGLAFKNIYTVLM